MALTDGLSQIAVALSNGQGAIDQGNVPHKPGEPSVPTTSSPHDEFKKFMQKQIDKKIKKEFLDKFDGYEGIWNFGKDDPLPPTPPVFDKLDKAIQQLTAKKTETDDKGLAEEVKNNPEMKAELALLEEAAKQRQEFLEDAAKRYKTNQIDPTKMSEADQDKWAALEKKMESAKGAVSAEIERIMPYVDKSLIPVATEKLAQETVNKINPPDVTIQQSKPAAIIDSSKDTDPLKGVDMVKLLEEVKYRRSKPNLHNVQFVDAPSLSSSPALKNLGRSGNSLV